MRAAGAHLPATVGHVLNEALNKDGVACRSSRFDLSWESVYMPVHSCAMQADNERVQCRTERNCRGDWLSGVLHPCAWYIWFRQAVLALGTNVAA